MSDGSEASPNESRVLIKFLLENRAMMSYVSILMIIYAVWATIEVLTNATGANWWPPETGVHASELYNNPNKVHVLNNGWIIATGAVFGSFGTMIQYFYRAAPYVDASMQATAALIISAVKAEEIEESAEKRAKEIVAAEKEEAAEAEAEEAEAEVAEEEAEVAEEEAEVAEEEAAEEVEEESDEGAESPEEEEEEPAQRKKF